MLGRHVKIGPIPFRNRCDIHHPLFVAINVSSSRLRDPHDKDVSLNRRTLSAE